MWIHAFFCFYTDTIEKRPNVVSQKFSKIEFQTLHHGIILCRCHACAQLSSSFNCVSFLNHTLYYRQIPGEMVKIKKSGVVRNLISILFDTRLKRIKKGIAYVWWFRLNYFLYLCIFYMRYNAFSPFFPELLNTYSKEGFDSLLMPWLWYQNIIFFSIDLFLREKKTLNGDIMSNNFSYYTYTYIYTYT